MADPREARQAALRTLLAADGFEQLLVQSLPNIRYLTGFSGSAGVLLVRRDDQVLVTDFRYAAQAPREVGGAARVEVDQTSVWDRLRKVLAERPGAGTAFEAHVATVRDRERLEGLLPGRSWTPAPALVERLRAVKDAGEVAAIRRAAALAQAALAETLPAIRAGQSEYEVAALLEGALRRRGSEWHPFPTIVASGPRAALPHARTSERVLARGEWLLLDFGAQVDGYCADLTRTFLVGARADERQRTVYDTVRRAQRRALDHVRAGMSGKDADLLAREVIARQGYGESFGHSLGHGLGLEVHEAPRLSPTAEAALPAGAVVTVEPGIYLPGWGGVRLEDDVHLTPDGPELLSDNRVDLLELV
ncbi:MAG: aminopeptidase P family protein [Gemmatimonadetes bacterium]|nr:aminopeptidase P family protein [Gemmatimonadota bacterium]MBK7923754.1 aminopeptidase P family protein [Gemmatimonadota bacterium]MBK9069141.1 aminopeptidase P family protein [Gemmatimonadota bacterium]